MLYSKSQSSEKFDLFALFVSKYLSGSNDYKNVIDKVVEETHELALGQKNIYEIDRDKFNIIVYLKDSDSAYFQKIDPLNLGEEDYKKISTLIGRKVVLNA